MKKLLLTFGVIALSLTVAQAQYDDIYYNPKSDNNATQKTQKKKQKKSYYIEDFSNMDVDEYNRANDTYYSTPVDTIGARVGEDQDFVYTQQIQKFYNPTIVVDNANLLDDVLNNSYGNVEVVINNNGLPVFSPYYSSFYYDNPFYWSGVWGPSWTWTWGPSWAWGPAWGGPGWSGGWNRPFYADYRPRAHRPVRPNYGMANNHGGNYNGGYGYGRPGSNRAPSNSGVNAGNSTHNRQYAGNRRGYNDVSNSVKGTSGVNIGTSNSKVYNSQSNRRQTTTGASTSNRRYSTQSQSQSMSTSSGSVQSGNRAYGTYNRNAGTNRSNYGTSNRTTTKRDYNTSTSRSTYNSSSSSHRSSGGSYGGGSRGGYSGGGSRGGGGHRR